MLTLDNPVFTAYGICAALGVLKIMGQGWMTVRAMMQENAGFVSPEDLRAGAINAAPDPAQLLPNDRVERSRRMHRNDLENIPAFWVAGLLFVLIGPPLWAAWLLFFGFVAARIGHMIAYGTAQSHEMRATFYSIGSLIVMIMAFWVLVVLVTG